MGERGVARLTAAGCTKFHPPGTSPCEVSESNLTPSPSVGASLDWTLPGTPGQRPVRARVWGELETLHFGVQCLETLQFAVN